MGLLSERRRAPRAQVTLPVLVEKIRSGEPQMPVQLAHFYERVLSDSSDIGMRFPAVVEDLSENGCFVVGPPLPLLSRVAALFALPSYGQVEIVGWTLWRRRSECGLHLTTPGGPRRLRLRAGFGLLFEYISLEARQAIRNLVRLQAGGPAS